jgi:hypothetical protein
MSLTIRSATTADQFAIRRLAVLDSASPPTGEVLLAEIDGELWAAPFRPSADVVDLLRFRAGRLLAQAA